MGWPKELVLVRHAQSVGNTMDVDERAMYNQSNHAYPLTPLGRKQAKITGEWLRERYGKFDVRYSSYYERAKETLQILCPGENLYEDPRLAEARRGIYHTHTFEEMQRLHPKELERKEREGLYHYCPPGGENWPDIELRIHSFLGTLSRDCERKKVLVVVHGHWLILFQRLIHRFSIDEAMRRYKGHVVGNASVTIYRGTGRDSSRLELAHENIIPWEGQLKETSRKPRGAAKAKRPSASRLRCTKK